MKTVFTIIFCLMILSGCNVFQNDVSVPVVDNNSESVVSDVDNVDAEILNDAIETEILNDIIEVERDAPEEILDDVNPDEEIYDVDSGAVSEHEDIEKIEPDIDA
ncbi:hypothetical protein JW758_03075 [Candidatus Peregrinibacteria bacterium]|nr:hypothetical protein [Candidatus Peregrinibacteria bacterium]